MSKQPFEQLTLDWPVVKLDKRGKIGSMRPEDSPYICWVDLETTGNRDTDRVLEVGAVLTDRAMNEVASISLVTRMQPHWIDQMESVVLAMHTGNGLIEDSWKSHLSNEDVDFQMQSWIKEFTSGDHIPLAGSGVSHFDRFYIKKDLPYFNRYLSYWSYDTGTIRRTLKLFGIDASFADTTSDKTHRALDDIRAHVEEMRRYRKMFRQWEGLAVVTGELVDSAGKPI